MKWTVPRWSAARELKKLAPVVFSAGPVIRIVGASLLLGAAICLGAKIALPQLQLAFVGKALLAIPAMFAYVGLHLLLHLIWPGQVLVTDRHILHSTGQSGWRAKLAEIESARLIIMAADRIWLVLRVKGKRHKFALPPTSDLDRLAVLLDPLEVLDKRTQFAAAKRRKTSA